MAVGIRFENGGAVMVVPVKSVEAEEGKLRITIDEETRGFLEDAIELEDVPDTRPILETPPPPMTNVDRAEGLRTLTQAVADFNVVLKDRFLRDGLLPTLNVTKEPGKAPVVEILRVAMINEMVMEG